MSSDPNTIASLLDRMEKAALVERKPHETDRRAHRVQVLEKGRKLYVELRDIAVSLQTSVLEVLPDDRRAQFLADLEVIADACLLAAKDAPQTTIIKKPSAE
jgi:DNA-binding MarR family transcriptional regulator